MHPSGYDDGGRTYGPKIIRDWNDLAQKELEKAMKMDQERNLNVAKNLILFFGDGLGTLTFFKNRI